MKKAKNSIMIFSLSTLSNTIALTIIFVHPISFYTKKVNKRNREATEKSRRLLLVDNRRWIPQHLAPPQKPLFPRPSKVPSPFAVSQPGDRLWSFGRVGQRLNILRKGLGFLQTNPSNGFFWSCGLNDRVGQSICRLMDLWGSSLKSH